MQFLVGIHQLCLQPDEPPVDLYHLFELIKIGETERAIEVTSVGDDMWRIVNGRHRFLAAAATGKHDMLAEEV